MWQKGALTGKGCAYSPSTASSWRDLYYSSASTELYQRLRPGLKQLRTWPWRSCTSNYFSRSSRTPAFTRSYRSCRARASTRASKSSDSSCGPLCSLTGKYGQSSISSISTLCRHCCILLAWPLSSLPSQSTWASWNSWWRDLTSLTLNGPIE